MEAPHRMDADSQGEPVDVMTRLQLACAELSQAVVLVSEQQGTNSLGMLKRPFLYSDGYALFDPASVEELVRNLRACSEDHARVIANIGDWICDGAVRSISQRVSALDGLVATMKAHVESARERRWQNFCLLAVGAAGFVIGLTVAIGLLYLVAPGHDFRLLASLVGSTLRF
ncbi:DUF6118 family protein [Rhizobium sp. ZPR3]|uniref:DUF6118 family protein n=2 Tax=unclassified Rhizobium TaxID=2613769 RepID=A0AAU7SN04_9HYPH